MASYKNSSPDELRVQDYDQGGRPLTSSMARPPFSFNFPKNPVAATGNANSTSFPGFSSAAANPFGIPAAQSKPAAISTTTPISTTAQPSVPSFPQMAPALQSQPTAAANPFGIPAAQSKSAAISTTTPISTTAQPSVPSFPQIAPALQSQPLNDLPQKKVAAGPRLTFSTYAPPSNQAHNLLNTTDEPRGQGSLTTVGGVGLSDAKLSSARSRMLDLINRLHDTGVQADIGLPQIAVIGSQSVGKSSLIEAISGITLPRASGTCTRCPTECRLSSSNESWECQVALRFTVDNQGNSLDKVKTVPFGDTITEKSKVEDRLRRAQKAILHPSVDPKHFLEAEYDQLADHDDDNVLSFSANCILLDIRGPDVADLSFCDLPGMIATVGEGGKESDISLVRRLISSYISKANCLILLAVACETDFENQGAHQLAKEHDIGGQRTIGVLTKPDRIEVGNEAKWLKILRNEQERLANGWFCVKQPDPQELSSGILWTEARGKEESFFGNNKPWDSLPQSAKLRLGTGRLTQHLSDVLSKLIAQRLPGIQTELQQLLDETRRGLHGLPRSPPQDPIPEVLRLVHNFQRDITDLVSGASGKELVQSIRVFHIDFQRDIRNSAPNFCPFERSKPHKRQRPAFISEEEFQGEQQNDLIFVEDVMDRALKARTRELPGHYPWEVQKDLIVQFTESWDHPALILFGRVQAVLEEHMKRLVHKHFSQHTYGGLEQAVLNAVVDQMQACRDGTLAKLEWVYSLEKDPFTLNTHYLSDYNEKFLTYYRTARQRNGPHSDFVKQIEASKTQAPKPIQEIAQNMAAKNPSFNSAPSAPLPANNGQTPVQEVMSGLARMSGPFIQPTELGKLLPSDPMEPALKIMADVRAYYQVAYKRYSDNIPLTIDREFVRGFDLGIQDSLIARLGLGEPQAKERFRGYLEQNPSIVAQREELEGRRDRLEAARAELLRL